jgi:putative transport protein
MSIDLMDLLSKSEPLVLFVCIALGYWLGNLHFGPIQLGAGGGVLLVGIVFGHFGFQADPMIGTVGFILFIYSVGYQAGPRFFSVFLTDGPKYVALALAVAVIGYGLAKALSIAVGLDPATAAGVLAGALTSTPTLIGAQTAVESGALVLGPGESAEQLLEQISVGYAITYVFGTVGLMMIIRFMPQWLRVDLPEEAARFARERGYDDKAPVSTTQRPIVRAYTVEHDEYVGRTLRDVSETLREDEIILRIKRDGELIEPEPDFVIALHDAFSLLATPERHRVLRERFDVRGDIIDDDLLADVVAVEEIILTNPELADKPIDTLGINDRFGCFLTSIRRSQIELPLGEGTTSQVGDILTVAGARQMLDSLIEELGVVEAKVQETDLVTFAAGISVGLLLGLITVKLGGLDVGLGTAGGLLLTGIAVGHLRSRNPTFGRVPPAARFILMELGLVLFLVGVGLRAGGGIVEALATAGPVIVLVGVVVTVTPVGLGYVLGRLGLKINPAVLLGALTGAMTSTPALSIVQDAAKSPVPALGYAGTYAFANILLTLAGAAMMLT